MIDLGLGHIRLGDALTPDHAVGAGSAYLAPGGAAALRSAIAGFEGVPSNHVAVTTGASMGLVAALAILPRPGIVLCPRPYYPAYPKVCRQLGFDVVFYDLEESEGWRPDPDRFRDLAGPGTRAILWNFPANPAGSMPTPEWSALLAAAARRTGGVVISDEVYADFVYGDEPTLSTELAAEGLLVRIRSFSKTFRLAGERLGYVIARPDLIDRIASAHWDMAMSAPAFAQDVAREILGSAPAERVRDLRNELASRRDLAAALLVNGRGVRTSPPQGGIFFWVELVDCALDSREIVRTFAERSGVLVVPGVAFGIEQPTFIRMSFAVPERDLVEGIRRLSAAVENVRGIHA